ncbi:hypothetical protein ABFS83_14G172100 [Erythranthe nasuta]
MAQKIHVLLVEPDSKDHDKTLNMLHYYSYEVTPVKLASSALSILSKDKVKFDLVMANLNSPDSCGLQLLQDVVKRDLVLILMSNDDDPVIITRAIEQGAFLCIKKPVTMQIAGYLWQHVLSEKVSRLKENERVGDFIIEFGNQLDNAQESKKNNVINFVNGSTSQNDSVLVKKKVWAEWSDELHQKFMVAAIELGDGRCYPKEILERMNVPELTRMQVASHLQKCRNAKWLPPGKRKSKQDNHNTETETVTTAPKPKVGRSRTERFGSMPRLDDYTKSHLAQKYQQEMNNQEFAVDSNPPMIESNNMHGNFNPDVEGYNGQLLLGHDNTNYPFALDNNDAFNMGQIRETFGVDDEQLIMYGFQNVIPNSDDVTNSMGLLGMDYNGSFQSLVLDADVNFNQMSIVGNAINEWGEGEESMKDEEIDG